MEELFRDLEYCKKTLTESRNAFGSIYTTEKQYDQMEKTLAFMYLYCPKEFRTLAEAAIGEAARRRIYYEINIWPNQNTKS